jgi:hypothetical protein
VKLPQACREIKDEKPKEVVGCKNEPFTNLLMVKFSKGECRENPECGIQREQFSCLQTEV